MIDPTCPTHGKVLVCPSCRAAEIGRRGGQIGGLATSRKKARAAKRNAKLPRPRAE